MPISTTELYIKTENVSVQSAPLLKIILGNNLYPRYYLNIKSIIKI